ncbi:MAG: ABC transporter substrate-binding protein [Archangium sp.]|nr:ABC transporter substrate-binding protein [Archangium sp.]
MRTLTLLCCLAWLGCRSSSAADAAVAPPPPPVSPEWLEGRLPVERGAPRDGGTLAVRVMNEPGCLNHLADSCRDSWVSRMTNRLVTQTLLAAAADDATLKPELAAEWKESDDHTVSTFTLRKTTFSNGTPLTAADVIATFDAMMDPKRPTGAIRGEFSALGSWKALEDGRVQLTWSKPSPFALRALARLPILSAKELAGDWGKIQPIGTGPFVIEKWDRGQALTLARRPGGAAYLERIVFRFVKDHTAAGAMFERGEFDLMTSITPAFWRSLEDPKSGWARRDWNRIKSLDNSYSYIAWNEARPFFADVRVRRALAHLYDTKLITKIVDLDLELPTTCPYFRGGGSCDPGVQPFAFSPDTARALLADAGFEDSDDDGVLERDGVPLRFTFLLPSTQVRLGKLVPMLQEQLKPVGVEVQIEKVETSSLSARVQKRDFDVVSRLWTEFDREQDLYPMFHSSQIDGGSNWIGYSNPEVDRLIEQVRVEFDEAKRHQLEQALHGKLYADQPYLFMTTRQSLDAAKKRVHGLQPSVLWYDLRAVWVSD